MSTKTARIFHVGAIVALCFGILGPGLLPHEGAQFCGNANPLGEIRTDGERPVLKSAAQVKAECESDSFTSSISARPWMPAVGIPLAAVLMGFGVWIGGLSSLSIYGSAAARERNEREEFLATFTPPVAAPAGNQLRLHRMGRTQADGSIGWWIEVPDDMCPTSVRLQATPAAPMQLHIGVDGSWITNVRTEEAVLEHPLNDIRPGQIFIRASLLAPSTETPMIEMWIAPSHHLSSAVNQQPPRAA